MAEPAPALRGSVEDWVVTAAVAADAKTDDETVVLDVGEVLGLTSWFVVTSGRNPRQVKAIVEEIELQVAEAGGPRPLRVEGLDAREWVLIDYGDFVVHVFMDESRRFYDLERLWSDVPRLDWRSMAGQSAASNPPPSRL